MPEIKKKRMQAEKKREEIKQLYHQYRQGNMGKAEYLARKKWEGNLAGEMETELVGLEVEVERLRKKIEEVDADDAALAEWLGCGESKRKLLRCLIECVEVNKNKEINITWLFQDKAGLYQ
ncbi:MAG: hypothetical protein HFG60_00820 [Lachnospiraceae bacterium]|nr:hypothetical protein [Lachnospiraceae bacterium]